MKPEGKEVARKNQFTIERASHGEAWLLVRANHYSKSCSKTGLAWKASDRYGNTVAAAVFRPPLPPSSKSVEQLAKQRGRVCVCGSES
jgi:hypothetical protein